MSYTPGPWEAMMDKNGIVHICPDAKHEYNICEVIESPTSLSNARLIAAAPDLLEALESIRGIEAWITDPKMKDLFQRKVYPAINKARGL